VSYPVWQAFVGVLICAVLWGSAFPSIKSVYAIWAEDGVEVSGWTRWWFAGVRFVIAGGALLLIAREPWKGLKRTPVRLVVTMAACQTFFQYILFYMALAFASGSLCSLMTASGSFWWLLLAPLFGRAVWGGWRVWAILLVGACGVALAVYSPGDVSESPLLGVGIMLLANFGAAIAILVFGQVKETMGAKAATGFSLFFGGLGLCALGAKGAVQSGEMFSPIVMGITVYLAFVSAAAFTLWNELSTRFPVSLLATYRFMIPIFGVSLSVLILDGESFNGWILGGAGLVVLAMVLAQRLNAGLSR